MRILVTGAGGFLGSAVKKDLIETGFDVFTTSRSIETANTEKHFRVDITNDKDFERLSKIPRIDVVVHAAGRAHRFADSDEIPFERANVLGTKNVADFCIRAGVGHLILISTVAVYGNRNQLARRLPPIDERGECRPAGAYAISKYEAETTARLITRQSDTRLTILRPATIIGEGDPGNTRRLIRLIDKNRFVWVGDGRNLKTLIYKADAAAAVRAVIEVFGSDNGEKSDCAVNVFNVAGGALPMREIVGEIASNLGRKISGVRIPFGLIDESLRNAERLPGLKRIGRFRNTVLKWVAEEVFSGEKLRLETGFEPKIDVREGIRREVEFYKSQG